MAEIAEVWRRGLRYYMSLISRDKKGTLKMKLGNIQLHCSKNVWQAYPFQQAEPNQTLQQAKQPVALLPLLPLCMFEYDLFDSAAESKFLIHAARPTETGLG